jgi:hypothetical protein
MLGGVANEQEAEQAFIYSVLLREGGTEVLNFKSTEGTIGKLIGDGREIGQYQIDNPLKYPNYPATWEDDAVYPFWMISDKEEWREAFEN